MQVRFVMLATHHSGNYSVECGVCALPLVDVANLAGLCNVYSQAQGQEIKEASVLALEEVAADDPDPNISVAYQDLCDKVDELNRLAAIIAQDRPLDNTDLYLLLLEVKMPGMDFVDKYDLRLD